MPSRVSRLVAPLAAVAVAVSGCAATAATASDTLTFATDTQPDCLDPQVSSGDITALVDRNIFDSLVSMTPDGRFHPWLARSWTISPDELTYTFELVPGAVFHDGTPVDAEAVRATLDHAVDKNTKSQYAASLIRGYAGAVAVDRDTVEVRLSTPSAPFLQALSTAYLGIQSPKSLRDNAGALCFQPVGSGPFRFGSWTRNRSIVLHRNDDYRWGPASAEHTGPPRIRELTIEYVPENRVRHGMLTSGQADVVGALPPSAVSLLRHSADFRFLRADSPGAGYNLLLNSGRAPLSDYRVRAALLHAVRLDQLVSSIYFGQFSRSWSPIGPATAAYDPTVEGLWRHDPEQANRLLDEAGWTGRDAEGYRTRDGQRLSLKWPYTAQLIREQRDVLGQGVQAEAKRVGIEIRYLGEDSGTFIKDILGRDADLHAFSFVRSDPDVLRYLFASDQTSDRGGGNVFHLADPAVDGWLAAATASRDPAVRAENYALVQRHVMRNALIMPLYVPAYLVGAAARVRGLAFDAQAYPLFYAVSVGAP